MKGTFQQREEIHLGDLLRALKELPWQDEQQAAAIIHSLGFTVKPALPKEKSPNTIADNNQFSPHKPAEKTAPVSERKFTLPPPPQPPIDLPAGILQSELKPLPQQRQVEPAVPDWLTQNNTQKESKKQKPHRQSLLADNTSRGVLTAALATQREGDEIDIQSLIKHAVTGHLPQKLPRLSAGTLEQGCQLLLHYSNDMVPYWEDLNALAHQVQQSIGATQVELYEFVDEPQEAKRWLPPKQLDEWQPKKGKPLMVATDLGIGEQISTKALMDVWHPFIRQCEKVGAPLMLLIPWQRRYWPEQHLGSFPTLIHWHPCTSAAMIHRLFGQGHQIKP